jgi:hypothetical protein
METVKVKIAGIAPLLMNRFAVVASDEEKAKRKEVVPDLARTIPRPQHIRYPPAKP